MNGEVDVGYEIDRCIKYVVRLFKKSMIGTYNCTFDKKTQYGYKVSKKLEAYTIRKSQWK